MYLPRDGRGGALLAGIANSEIAKPASSEDSGARIEGPLPLAAGHPEESSAGIEVPPRNGWPCATLSSFTDPLISEELAEERPPGA